MNVPVIGERQLFVKERVRSPVNPESGFGGDTFQELMPTVFSTQAELAHVQAAEALELEKKKEEIEEAMTAGHDTKILRFESACLQVPWELYKREPRRAVDENLCRSVQDRATTRQPQEETCRIFKRAISILKNAGIVEQWETGTIWGQAPMGVQNHSQSGKDEGRNSTPTFYGFHPLNPRPLNIGLGWFGYDQVHGQAENGIKITSDMVQDCDWFASHERRDQNGQQVVEAQEPIIWVDEYGNNRREAQVILDDMNPAIDVASSSKPLFALLEEKSQRNQAARGGDNRGRGGRGRGAGRGRGRKW